MCEGPVQLHVQRKDEVHRRHDDHTNDEHDEQILPGADVLNVRRIDDVGALEHECGEEDQDGAEQKGRFPGKKGGRNTRSQEGEKESPGLVFVYDSFLPPIHTIRPLSAHSAQI